MAEDTEVQETQDTQEGTESAEGTESQEVEETSSESSQAAPQQQPDYEGKLRAMEEQWRRAEERNRYLEHTARLLEQQSQRQYNPQPQQQPQGNQLAPELLELERTLSPLLDRRTREVQQQFTEPMSRVVDEQDALRFETYLMRNHPEVFQEDGALDRILQDVEVVRRQAAQSYNQWLGRIDAFLYAEGIRGVQERVKTRKTKQVTQVKDEAKRVASTQAARSIVQGTPTRKNPGSEIQSIREKANRGERLSDAERAKYREFVSGVTF